MKTTQIKLIKSYKFKPNQNKIKFRYLKKTPIKIFRLDE